VRDKPQKVSFKEERGSLVTKVNKHGLEGTPVHPGNQDGVAKEHLRFLGLLEDQQA